MSSQINRVRDVFQHIQPENVPRGELWLGTDILNKAGFVDDLSGHIKFIKLLKQDMICLPTAHESFINKSLGYRYFSVGSLREAVETTNLFVVSVIDGPFQRLFEKRGMIEVMRLWASKKSEFIKFFEYEKAIAEDLIMRSLDVSVHGVVIADDIAGDSAIFLDPRQVDALSGAFYSQAVSKIHDAGSVAMFHSCGAISDIIPALLSYGFDALAAIQHVANDFISLKLEHKSRLIIMGGIDGELLEKKELSLENISEFKKLITYMSKNGEFILSSSCGLYSGRFLKRIQSLYSYL